MIFKIEFENGLNDWVESDSLLDVKVPKEGVRSIASKTYGPNRIPENLLQRISKEEQRTKAYIGL